MAWQLGVPDISSGLAQGVSGAGAALGQGIGAWADRRHRSKELDKDRAWREAQEAKELARREKQEAEELARLGKTLDLGQGYRGVVTGPRSMSVIAPEEKPFVPDEATRKQLQDAGYLWAQQSRNGGTFVPAGRAQNNPALGTTTDLGEGFRGVITGPGRMSVMKPPGGGPKPLDAIGATSLQAGVSELARIDQELVQHQTEMAKGDNRTGFLNVFSRQEKVNELLAQKAGLEAKLRAMQAGAASGTTPAVAPVHTPAPAQVAPAPSTPAPTTSAPANTAASGKVRVIAPDGRAGLIPAEQLQAALAAGYRQP